MTICFTVPGNPVGKARPRVTRHATYTPPKTKAYEAAVNKAFRTAANAQTFPDARPLFLFVRGYFSIPKSYPKAKKLSLPGTFHLKKPDGDNVAKAVQDALNGVAYPDDSAVCAMASAKWYTGEANGRTEVLLTDNVKTFVSAVVAEVRDG